MPNATASHPTPEVLSAYGLGKLTDPETEVIARHLTTCADCRRVVEGLPADSLVGLVRSTKQATLLPAADPANAPSGPGQSLLDSPAEPPPPPADLPPELAEHPRYRILRVLGRGGMGVVYEAEHRHMGRKVALKVISQSLVDRPEAVERFTREVRAAAKLNHPNIVTAHDAEQAGSLHLLVMEYVPGRSLAEVVEQKGPLPVAHACHFVRQAALGLQHASEQGMVHRDLKPHNLMVTPKGQVKILDFGLARLAAEKKVGPGLTAEDAVMGTPEYLAPEQALDARQADVRADIYSLGCTLYCLLAGQPPFPDGTAMQKIMAHLERQPRPLPEVCADVPADLWAVIERMLAKDPAVRYQQPVEVAQALVPFIKAGTKPAAGGVAAPPGASAAGAGTVLGGDTSKVLKLRKEAAEKPPVPTAPAPDESSAPFANLAGEATRPMPAKKAHAAAKPAAAAWFRNWRALTGAATAILILGLVGLWAAGVLKVKTPQGTIILENVPAAAEVTVEGPTVTVARDGKVLTVTAVSEGPYRLKVVQDGQEIWSSGAVTVKIGSEPIRITVPPPGPEDARVVLEIDRPGAEVFVDDQKMAIAAPGDYKPVEIKVKPGRHKLRISKSGFEDFTQNVEFRSGKTESIRVRLKPADDGFVSLFNGKDLTGWVVDSGDTAAWQMKEGILVARGAEVDDVTALHNQGYILSQREYSDFVLRFQFQQVATKYAWGGVALRAKPGETGQKTVQPEGPEGWYPFHLTAVVGQRNPSETTNPAVPGSLYWTVGSTPLLPPDHLAALKKVGEWNDMEIEMRGQSLRIAVNGRDVQNVMLNKTRPPMNPARGLSRFSGRIGFLKRVGEVRYRKIEIKDLTNPLAPPRDPAPPPRADLPAIDEAWLKSVAGLAPDKQVEAVVQKLRDLNPGFDGKVTPKVEGGVVTELQLVTDQVADLSPVRALTGLQALQCPGSHLGLGQLADLSPLKGMKLTSLNCGKTRVSDLSPLKGMKLTGLECRDTSVSDLSPLEGMPLTSLSVRGCGQVRDLTPLKGMPLTALLCDHTRVSDLAPLKGMKLTELLCGSTPVSDLSPLQGMPLTNLGCMGTLVSDLSPLKGMPLSVLWLKGSRVTDLTPLRELPLTALECDFQLERDTEILRSIKTLHKINGTPAAQLWKEVDAKVPPPASRVDEAWLKSVAGLAPDKQVEAVVQKLRDLNPGFDGKVTPKVEGGVVTELQLVTDQVTDLSPVRALTQLRALRCSGSNPGKGQLADLSPLKGMLLTQLSCNNTPVSDLSPLKDMKLTSLSCYYTRVSDLSPLSGMNGLEYLGLVVTPVTDLRPLQGLKLRSLEIHATPTEDLSPLQGMPLKLLNIHRTRVKDLSPLKGMELVTFTYAETRVTDISVLKDMPLSAVGCSFQRERDEAVLRSLKTLKTINGTPVSEFWKEMDGKTK